MSLDPVVPVKVKRYKSNIGTEEPDLLVVEEPLQIKLDYGPQKKRKRMDLSLTMRTPGHDFELVHGFLYNEGIIRSEKDVIKTKYCKEENSAEFSKNIVRVDLNPTLKFDKSHFKRNFYTNSSCGVCGKTSIDSLKLTGIENLMNNDLQVNCSTILRLTKSIQKKQMIFKHTGGLHASALFDKEGNLLRMREDIGRHNALDKLVGSFLDSSSLPLSSSILLLSGRAGFELIQKAIVAGIPVVASVGAPSSLAMDLAKEFGQTLIGFLKEDSFNIYNRADRVSE